MPPRAADPPDELADGIHRLLAEAGGDPEVRVTDLRRLSGGASRETWAVTTEGPSAGRRELILQRTRPGPVMSGNPSMATEDLVLEAARARGVPVPPTVVDVATAAPVIGEARITERVPGEALGSRLVRAERTDEARRDLARQMARALAGIHAVDPAEVPGLTRRDPLRTARDGLDLMGEARPAFELALRWLDEHRPEPGPEALVHGDFRVGNLLIDGDRLTGVLDWELCHLGDPLEDLGWLCVRAWRFGGEHEVGGLAALDDLVDAYSEARGVPVDPEAVRWWIVAGTLTWGLICAVQARRHLDGHVRSVELATIGRRICENEYDVLGLIGVAPPGAPAGAPGTGGSITGDGAAPPAADPGLHGRPTASELVEAVRGHLAEEVAPLLEGAAGFHLKVTGTALGIVARELELGPVLDAAHRERLAALGVADERELAAAIRSGAMAGRDDVSAAVRAAVVDRLRVANPRWLLPPDA